jgi:hypothetical protein
MSTFQRFGLGVFAFLIVLAMFRFAPAQKDAAKNVQKWEYLTAGETEMNDYGEAGWELVCVTRTRSDQPAVAYYKRPK